MGIQSGMLNLSRIVLIVTTAFAIHLIFSGYNVSALGRALRRRAQVPRQISVMTTNNVIRMHKRTFVSLLREDANSTFVTKKRPPGVTERQVNQIYLGKRKPWNKVAHTNYNGGAGSIGVNDYDDKSPSTSNNKKKNDKGNSGLLIDKPDKDRTGNLTASLLDYGPPLPSDDSAYGVRMDSGVRSPLLLVCHPGDISRVDCRFIYFL